MAGSGATVSVMPPYLIRGRQRGTVASITISGFTFNLGVGSLGLQKYTDVQINTASFTSGMASFVFNFNMRSGSTAAPGVLYGSGFTAGDNMIITAFGY